LTVKRGIGNITENVDTNSIEISRGKNIFVVLIAIIVIFQ